MTSKTRCLWLRTLFHVMWTSPAEFRYYSNVHHIRNLRQFRVIFGIQFSEFNVTQETSSLWSGFALQSPHCQLIDVPWNFQQFLAIPFNSLASTLYWLSILFQILEMTRRCGFFLNVFGLKMPDYLDCAYFPENANSDVCVGHHEAKEAAKRAERPGRMSVHYLNTVCFILQTNFVILDR